MLLFSISQIGDIFNRIGAIGDSIIGSCRLFATAKTPPDNQSKAAEGVFVTGIRGWRRCHI